MKEATNNTHNGDQTSKRIAIVRIAFGLVWLADASLKFEPAFFRGIFNIVKAADSDSPSWLNWWFHSWFRVIGAYPHLFAALIMISESLLALMLLAGVARKVTYIGGAILSFLLWAVGEGFGGPYVAGSTDIGAGIVYVLAFILLLSTDTSKAPALSLEPTLRRLLRRRSADGTLYNHKPLKTIEQSGK
ncbi:MAG TPA: hypothetical protein VFN51_02655 [Candidatus Saccharimonadales bacterium]|nr:hypothetical protein [Candidatus Saccharimonadales bacterium]